MNRYYKSILLNIFLVLGSSLYAKSVDVLKYDIAGIKLGMTPDEVKKIILDTYHPNGSELSIGTRYGERKKGERESYIGEIHYTKRKDQSISLQIKFCLIPQDGNETSSLQAEDIIYSIKGIEENIKKIRKMAVSKYGEPTKKSDYSYVWCENIDSKTHNCDLYEPKLTTYSASVMLTNYLYSKKADEIMHKWKIVEPKF